MKRQCGGFLVEELEAVNGEFLLVYPITQIAQTFPILGRRGWFTLETDSNSSFWVHKSFVKPVAEARERFQVGDYVTSIVRDNKGFVGQVVSFETDGGVVCKSIRCQDRVRFTYRPEELKKCSSVKPTNFRSTDVIVVVEDGSGQIHVRNLI